MVEILKAILMKIYLGNMQEQVKEGLTQLHNDFRFLAIDNKVLERLETEN